MQLQMTTRKTTTMRKEGTRTLRCVAFPSGALLCMRCICLDVSHPFRKIESTLATKMTTKKMKKMRLSEMMLARVVALWFPHSCEYPVTDSLFDRNRV